MNNTAEAVEYVDLNAQLFSGPRRSTARRVFYIDVGNMPVSQAQAYVKSIQADMTSRQSVDGV